tara:strand:+ start:250 stop:1041 length:792 start_codon:yes stop_codon:yes gene_type:complete
VTKIKILSGWSNPGGSTVAFINLCNLFNENGLDCTFYGPHEWHSTQCKGEPLGNCAVNEEDEILIAHFLKLPGRPEASRKVILSCHEKAVYPVKDVKQFWDEIVYVSDEQRKWQGLHGDIIPNVMSPLKDSGVNPKGIAGVIGTIGPPKQTRLSIDRAFDQGYSKVLLYGNIGDSSYYDSQIKPILSDKVIYMDHEFDKQKMYDSVEAVFQTSVADYETYGLTKAECLLTNTLYYGTDNCDLDIEVWNNEKILNKWKDLLEIK